jgi:hypothetical protein
MAIGSAIERGDYVYVYDERGRQLFTKPVGSGPKDGLHGYNGGSVSIRQGDYVQTYDAKGYQLASTPAR